MPPGNIINYDETNLQNNPGSRQTLVKRGQKYAEQVRNHGKEAITVMFAGSAFSEMLLPYVIYQAKYVSDNWIVGGPPGTMYHSSPSGWSDQFLFTDWFKKIPLPYLKKLPGKKVMIGDNLSSHFSDEVLWLCGRHNIEFVCLPANSTHKLQPLDVGFFAPMKRAWRGLLDKENELNPNSNALVKPKFPVMLASLLLSLDIKTLLMSAFKETHFLPFWFCTVLTFFILFLISNSSYGSILS